MNWKEYRFIVSILTFLALCLVLFEVSAKEKLACDPIDAPYINPESLILSIEKRINALDELLVGLRKAREELKAGSTIEQWSNAGVLLAATVKHTSAIILTVSGGLAVTAEALAVSIVANTSNFVIDAVNNSQASQNDTLKNALSSYGVSNIDLMGSNLLNKSEIKGAWSTIFGLGSFVKETFDLVNLANIYGSANMQTQIKGVNKQIARYEKDISILKEELERTKRKVGETTQKINTGFIDIVTKYNNSNPPLCKKERDKVTSESVEQIMQNIKATIKPTVLPVPRLPSSSLTSNDPYQTCYLRKASCEQSCSGATCLQSCEDEWYECRYGSESLPDHYECIDPRANAQGHGCANWRLTPTPWE